MRLAVIVLDMGQILAGHLEQIRAIVVADGQHDGSRVTDPPDSPRRFRLECKYTLRVPSHLAIFGGNREYLFFERYLKRVGVDGLPVVLERVCARGLVVRRDKGQAADFEQLWRREEDEIGRKTVDRVDEDTLLQNLIVKAPSLGRNRRRQPGRPRTHDNQIPDGHHLILRVPPDVRQFRLRATDAGPTLDAHCSDSTGEYGPIFSRTPHTPSRRWVARSAT